MDKEKKKSVMGSFASNERDTGSAPVQIALLSQRIKDLTQHLQSHSQDEHSRRGLLMMVGKRRRLLAYLARQDHEAYLKLLSQLGLRR